MITYKLRLKYKIIFSSVSVALAAFILLVIPNSSYYNSINNNANSKVTIVSNSDHTIISKSDTKTLPVAKENDKSIKDTTQTTTQSTTKVTASDVVELNAIEKFVNIYNQNAKEKITNLTTIDIHDENGGHYRTEFRLLAFENADAMTGVIGTNSLDIIICHRYFSDAIRFYLTTDSLDDAVAFSDIKQMSAVVLLITLLTFFQNYKKIFLLSVQALILTKCLKNPLLQKSLRLHSHLLMK